MRSIARSRCAVGANRGKACLVGDRPVIDLVPLVQRGEHRLDLVRAAKCDEHPAAFLAPFGETGVTEDLHMARHPRLTLPQHLRQLADRQLHRAQQRQDAQARRVGQGPKDGERGLHGKDDI